MSDEYQKNQTKQKNLFKKYKKSIRNMVIGATLGISSFFLFPYLGLAEVLGPTYFVLSRIGVSMIGLVSSLYNGLKAHYIGKSLNNEMDYEQGLIEGIELSSLKKDDKIKKLEEALNKEKNKININNNDKVIINEKDNNINNFDVENEIVKTKTK